jgi:hypothetical protein
MNETVAAYRMNPAEDEIRFGDELTEGMWVLPEDISLRPGVEASEDERIRGQRFRRVTRLRRESGYGAAPEKIVFVGEWVDGYQEIHTYAVTFGWLVKKDASGEKVPTS